jgi:hypothetical protein
VAALYRVPPAPVLLRLTNREAARWLGYMLVIGLAIGVSFTVIVDGVLHDADPQAVAQAIEDHQRAREGEHVQRP